MAALCFGFVWVGFYATTTKVSTEEFGRKRVSDWLNNYKLAESTSLSRGS